MKIKYIYIIFGIIILCICGIFIFRGIHSVEYQAIDRIWVNKYHFEYYLWLKPLIEEYYKFNNSFPTKISDLKKYDKAVIETYRNNKIEYHQSVPIDKIFNIKQIRINNIILYKIEGNSSGPVYYDRIEKCQRYLVIDDKYRIYPEYSSPYHIQKYIFWRKIKVGIIKENIEDKQ